MIIGDSGPRPRKKRKTSRQTLNRYLWALAIIELAILVTLFDKALLAYLVPILTFVGTQAKLKGFWASPNTTLLLALVIGGLALAIAGCAWVSLPKKAKDPADPRPGHIFPVRIQVRQGPDTVAEVAGYRFNLKPAISSPNLPAERRRTH